MPAMIDDITPKYKLAEGVQVREENFGLLFYSREGPRLYFLPSGRLIRSDFFHSDATLQQWLEAYGDDTDDRRIPSLQKALNNLCNKGVLVEF